MAQLNLRLAQTAELDFAQHFLVKLFVLKRMV